MSSILVIPSSHIAAPTGLAIGIGAACGIVYFGTSFWLGGRQYFRFWKTYTPQFPTPPAERVKFSV